MHEDITELKFVRFDSVPFGSFLNVKARGMGERNAYFNELLQITLRNGMFVFNLDVRDEQVPMEVQSVQGID